VQLVSYLKVLDTFSIGLKQLGCEADFLFPKIMCAAIPPLSIILHGVQFNYNTGTNLFHFAVITGKKRI
jgi:hypothetical protein